MSYSKQVYYSATEMLRYNPLWAFVNGGRSIGKSFEFRQRSINTMNSLWVYLRRTDKQRLDPKNWKSYCSDLLLENKISQESDYKITSEGIWVDGIQKVIFASLNVDSTAHSMNYLPDTGSMVKDKKKRKIESEFVKSTMDSITDMNPEDADDIKNCMLKKGDDINNLADELSEYNNKPLSKKIVFEEYIEPTNKYLKNEIFMLFEFYSTVDRYSGTQLFGLGNTMTAYNPYFDFFGIIPTTKRFTWYKNKTLLVENVNLPGHSDFVKNQRFYNLVEGTEYGDYLTDNSPWMDDSYNIMEKPKDGELLYNIVYEGKIYGVWCDKHRTKEYVSKKHNPQYTTYASLKSMKDEYYPIKKGETAHKWLNDCIINGNLYFDDIGIRNDVYAMIQGGYRNG